jgi:hypothetical protein
MFGRARKLATAGSLAFALVFVAGAAAQQDSPTAPNSNNIMGFEANGTWIVTGNSSPPGFSAGITTNRTQGSAAYAVANPPNQVKITSQPIASTATALAGIGDNGALLQIDVLIPLQQGNTVNSGYIQPYVSSRSRGLSKVPLTQVFFNSYREGIYSTIAFPLPNAVGSALKGATFSDLTFEFDISSPGKITGAYLLDNLRVHSVTLVQSPTSDTPIPPGYGGSVDLLAYGDAPATQTFPIGPTQIPLGFQFTKLIDKASPKLFLGLDGKPTTTCTYDPDPNDSTMLRYVLNTCDNGFKAGDLINANWVSLAIIGGDATDKLRAQLALNPMGDLTGAGIIPPMPTFWGTAYSCIPAPVAGKVVTTSTSCAAQTAQANQIMKQYFTQLKNANPPPNWIVPPVPSFALRHGDGTPNNNLLGVPPPPNDPPFDSGGDLNPGGSFDAYWRLNGNLTPTPPVTGSDETKTHFDAAFTAHGVLFGEDVDVVDAKVVADTDSGRTTPLPAIAATSTGTLAFYVFGVELPSGQDLTISPSTGFSIDPKWSQEYNLPPIQIWIFTVTLGATADAEFMATGSAALAGVDLNLLPSASLGGHVSGGINLGIASGSVDAKVNLVKVSTPVTAQAKWVIDTRPQVCSATLDGHLKGDLDLSSGGGEVDLKATFGFCPFCDTESETLVKWGPLASSTLKLFDDTIDVQLFGLPASLCAFPVTATINSPVPAATLSSGLPITLTGTAAPTDSTIPVSSTTYAWTYTPGTNASGSTASVNTMGATGPNPRVTFPAPTSGTTSAWTIGMTATVSTTSAGGTVVTSTASATPVTVSVSSLTSGAYITQVSGDVSGLAIPDAAGVFVLPMMSNAPPGESGIFTTGTVTVSGVVVGGSGSLNTTFNISTCNDIDSNGYTATCSCPSPFTATTCPSGSTPLTTANPTTNTPSATSPALQSGTYKITIHTTSGGSDFGIPTSVLVWVPQPIV